jgi:SAM-dependent methyltransferase
LIRLDDPELVRREYATAERLAGRSAIYSRRSGPDPVEIAFAAVGEVGPRRVLEVGGGRGEFGSRLLRELEVELVEIDQSEHMVDLMRRRGLDALVGDVQSLPFADGAFDVAVANWMLYHVPDLDRGVAELERVLRPGGRLVAITNGAGHLRELFALAGLEPVAGLHSFIAENGEDVLRRSFASVERRDAPGEVLVDHAAAVRYLESVIVGELTVEVEPFDGDLVVHSVSTVFVAEKKAVPTAGGTRG